MKEGVLWYKYILRVSCKRSSACTQSTDAMCIMVQWNSILFRQAVQGVLVPRLTKHFPENHSFKCQIDLTGK